MQHQRETPIKVLLEKLDAQLVRWRLKIDRLAAKNEAAGAPNFDAVMYVDELKALHAIARSKVAALRDGKVPERARLKGELRSVWNDLVAALKSPMPPL